MNKTTLSEMRIDEIAEKYTNGGLCIESESDFIYFQHIIDAAYILKEYIEYAWRDIDAINEKKRNNSLSFPLTIKARG